MQHVFALANPETTPFPFLHQLSKTLIFAVPTSSGAKYMNSPLPMIKVFQHLHNQLLGLALFSQQVVPP